MRLKAYQKLHFSFHNVHENNVKMNENQIFIILFSQFFTNFPTRENVISNFYAWMSMNWYDQIKKIIKNLLLCVMRKWLLRPTNPNSNNTVWEWNKKNYWNWNFIFFEFIQSLFLGENNFLLEWKFGFVTSLEILA